MPAERAGYTVTMFLIDVSPSMGTTRTVELPDGPKGEKTTSKMTNLEWSVQFVLLKIQEMIFNGRKTEQCGVILFGTEETDNIVNDQNSGYEHVTEYIPIAQPNASTLAKIQALRPSTVVGDPIDAIIVGIETQDKFLGNKKSWTRKMVVVTDGENPIEVEDWEATVKKMNTLDIKTTVVYVPVIAPPMMFFAHDVHIRGVDFDDGDFGYQEEEKSEIKRENEKFFAQFTAGLTNGVLGTCAFALQECVRPEPKMTKSALMGYVLRIGDVKTRPEEAIEVIVKASKCTALVRPPSLKKFAKRGRGNEPEDAMDIDKDEGERQAVYAMLKMRTEYFIDRSHDDDKNDNPEGGSGEEKKDGENLEKVDKEELIRGFKYGSSYAPCPDGQFPKLPTEKGIDICGFFSDKNLRRDWAMSEVQYVWADPASGQQQVAFSSIVQAMLERGVVAFARWVTKDGMDPRMGVLVPRAFENVDCFLWVQMPFADDLRKYTFQSLESLVSKNGLKIKKHAYLPTDEQLEAMDNFVDAMDLMVAGDKDEDGKRTPWFDPRLSFNPAVHRIKQALFHAAIVTDLKINPLPPPHPEVVKYMEPPKRVLKRAQAAIDECQKEFKVRQVPKRVTRQRKDGHVRADDDDDEMLLLDRMTRPGTSQIHGQSAPLVSTASVKGKAKEDAGSGTEPHSGDEHPLPTPAPSHLSSLSPEPVTGRVPGRIIGLARPLVDFKKNIARGDIVTKAVEDLAWVVKDIAMKPFAARRHPELIECMQALRATCLNEDEIDAWNEFLRDLKDSCLSNAGISNHEFWDSIQEAGQTLGLITSEEAERLGGSSTVSAKEAAKFLRT